MRKRAQISGQIFIYILAIIIAGLVILYGYKAISSMIKTGEDIALIDFKNQIEGDMERLATSYGDVKTQSYILPGGTRTICFVDDDAIKNKVALDSPYPIINNAVQTGARQNIFLIPMVKIQLYAEGLQLNTDFLCINESRGRVNLRLEGKGDGTLVEKVQD